MSCTVSPAALEAALADAVKTYESESGSIMVTNPRTGETIEIPATYGVRISAGSLLKKAVTE